jgi:hypothetical protein
VQSYEEVKEKEIITLTSKSYANLFKQAAQDEKSNIVKD